MQHELKVGRFRPAVVAAVYNVLGSEIATSKNGSIGDYSECDAVNGTTCLANPLYGVLDGAAPGVEVVSTSFGQTADWQHPRRYELGVRFEF